MRTILALIALSVVSLCSCGGQRQTGSPNDPNEQQGNPAAQPEKSVTNKSNKEPDTNKAGKNAHTGLPNGQDNK
jgi:hypothetical protein